MISESIKQNWRRKPLYSVSHVEGEVNPDSQVTKAFAEFLGSSKQKIRIISGKLPAGIYASKNVIDALTRAQNRAKKSQNELDFEILTGPSSDEESKLALKTAGAKIIELTAIPVVHFAIVDDKNIRLEVPHSLDVKYRKDTIIYNTPQALDLELRYLGIKNQYTPKDL